MAKSLSDLVMDMEWALSVPKRCSRCVDDLDVLDDLAMFGWTLVESEVPTIDSSIDDEMIQYWLDVELNQMRCRRHRLIVSDVREAVQVARVSIIPDPVGDSAMTYLGQAAEAVKRWGR